MKSLAIVLAASTLFAAAPAFAQDTAETSTFTGPRAGAVAGFIDDDFGGTETFAFGGNVGYDFDLGGAVAGVTLEYQNSNDTGRELSAVGRIGVKAGERALVYGLAGYSNLGVGSGTGIELDGVRVGGGVEFAATENVYVNAEYRYSNYELDVDGHQMAFGIGFRF